jgi:hypothetical protein
MEPFNGLTPAQAKRLALLAEECGEVVQEAIDQKAEDVIYKAGRKLGVRVVLAKSDMSGLKNASPETEVSIQRMDQIIHAHDERK